jgi:hypothetical protein
MDGNMNTFSVGPPKTIFDWAALRDEFRGKLELLELETLSVLYGLSQTVGYQDDDFVREVKDYLSKSADPVRTRFDFAYHLGSYFWDTYELWGFENIQPGEPGYAGDFVAGFHDQVMEWLLEGLSTYPDEQEVIDYAFYLVSRTGMGDTFIEERDKPLMEAAANKEISFKTSAGGRRIAQIVFDAFEAERKKKGDEQKTNEE